MVTKSRAAERGSSDRSVSPEQQIERLKAQLRRARAHIAELQARADTDSLLVPVNRRGFERDLKRAIAFVTRYRVEAAVVFLDVDRLKPVNDSYGHAAGDALLKAVAAGLTRHVRASDIVGASWRRRVRRAAVESRPRTMREASGGAGTHHRYARLHVRRARHLGGSVGRVHDASAPATMPKTFWLAPIARCMRARRNAARFTRRRMIAGTVRHAKPRWSPNAKRVELLMR